MIQAVKTYDATIDAMRLVFIDHSNGNVVLGPHDFELENLTPASKRFTVTQLFNRLDEIDVRSETIKCKECGQAKESKLCYGLHPTKKVQEHQPKTK